MRKAIREFFGRDETKYTGHERTPHAHDTSYAHREYTYGSSISHHEAMGEYYAKRRPHFGAPQPVASSFPPSLSERERRIRDEAISDVLRPPSATQFGTIHGPDYATIEQAARVSANRSIAAARDSWYAAHPYAPPDSMPTDMTYRLATKGAEHVLDYAQKKADRDHRAAGSAYFPYS